MKNKSDNKQIKPCHGQVNLAKLGGHLSLDSDRSLQPSAALCGVSIPAAGRSCSWDVGGCRRMLLRVWQGTPGVLQPQPVTEPGGLSVKFISPVLVRCV